MSVNTFVGLCVYDMCLREKEEHDISIYGKIVSYLKGGDYCPWQQFEQLGGTAHHRVP